jgi:transcription-repair coupling factor (superfamily II helicase)
MKELILNSFTDLLHIPTVEKKISNLSGSSKALFVTQMAKKYREHQHIVVTSSEDEAITLVKDIQFYAKIIGLEEKYILFLPEGDDLNAAGKRMQTLATFCKGALLVGSENALLKPSWDRKGLQKNILVLKRGGVFRREALIERLQRMGYRRTSVVTNRGQFSERNWVFDIFPSNTEYPLRIEFFGDEIESLKGFEIDTQRSVHSIDAVEIMPAFEDSTGKAVYKGFGKDSIFYFIESTKYITPPETSFILQSISVEGTEKARLLPLSGMGVLHRERRDIYELSESIKRLIKENYRIAFVLNTDSQAERLKEILRDSSLIAPKIPPESLLHYNGVLALTMGNLSTGVHLPCLIILSSADIFGKGPVYRRRKEKRIRNILDSLEELKEGDYVVHREYGIGRFTGLKMLKSLAGLTEAMVIEYRDGAKLYVPIYNIGLIQKYKAEEGVIPILDRLDSRAWKRKKERIRKKIQEMAYRLLSLYAKRHVTKAHAFSKDTILHREFEDFFPFEETPDQIKAWEEIKSDMEKDQPMDRLLCGDVGFGKTELAMRAAFKAVYDGKQVALLVPTTLLCEQHYINFKERFSAFPVRIDYLSRFKTSVEKKKTFQLLEKGEIDIIIGTHLLLNSRVRFKNLGLLIIDEEHRFGVAQKERIKELKKNVDCLTMSATPIPRTLEMALSGIRQISLIETPPEERLAIKGVVTEFNDTIIKEAIERELERGGQVFFVHNRIQDIWRIEEYLEKLVPGTKIAVAHGQMRERELERVMLDFMKGSSDILLCTTIIGSGIDIPNANTILINEAHKIGLADLYQLKGRVGRSNRKAYAYFLVPPLERITEQARRRISAIEELNYLGAGLQLAIRDLEIRGAGNLLGKEQSGHINAVGIELYMEMLQQEVAALQGRDIEELPEPSIELKVDAFLPDDYIRDISVRINIYRRLYRAETPEEIAEIAEEIIDRFGPLPEEGVRLIEMMKLRVICKRLRVLSVKALRGVVRITVDGQTPLSPEKLSDLYEKGFPVTLYEDGFSLKTDELRPRELVQKIKEFLILCSN